MKEFGREKGLLVKDGTDQLDAYPASVKEYCPHAVVVWDRFHLVQRFNEALNEERKEELSRIDLEGEMGDLMDGKYRHGYLTKIEHRSKCDQAHIDQVMHSPTACSRAPTKDRKLGIKRDDARDGESRAEHQCRLLRPSGVGHLIVGQEKQDLFLLTPREIKRMRKLVRHLERALRELVELKRITTLDDLRDSFPPHESDLIEEASFIERQLASRFEKRNQDY